MAYYLPPLKVSNDLINVDDYNFQVYEEADERYFRPIQKLNKKLLELPTMSQIRLQI
ncbi:MAG: hypothetical protein H7196_05220 [candidate division SR1 bacterium]|nr:hypothetical protein [candidate division SR1 bacterium]